MSLKLPNSSVRAVLAYEQDTTATVRLTPNDLGMMLGRVKVRDLQAIFESAVEYSKTYGLPSLDAHEDILLVIERAIATEHNRNEAAKNEEA